MDWIEGKVLVQLGVTGRITLRRLRRAALGLVRLRLLGDALLCVVDLLEYAVEQGEAQSVLAVCQEVLDLAEALEADSYLETRRFLQSIIDDQKVAASQVQIFTRTLATVA